MTISDATGEGAAAGSSGSHDPGTDYLYGHTSAPELIDGARRLVARRYLEQGYITQDDIDDEGIMLPDVDPYHDTSTYFVAVDSVGDVVATIRQVEFDPVRGLDSFPFCAHLELSESTWRILASEPPHRWVELSGLAKEPWVDTSAANRLYREMWARSFAQEHRFWLIATHPLFARWLKGIFMSSVIKAGEPMEYLGSQTQPLVMEVVTALDGVVERYFTSTSPRVRARCRATVEYFLDGIDAGFFSARQVERFRKMGVEFSLDLRDGSLAVAAT